jgi:hypothetical protein
MLETERGRPRPLVRMPPHTKDKRDGTRTPSSARTEAAAHKEKKETERGRPRPFVRMPPHTREKKRRNADALVRSYGGPPAHKGKIDFALRLLCELGVLCVKTST